MQSVVVMSFVPAKKRWNGDVIYFGCEKNRTNIAPAQETLKIRLKISQKSLKTLIKSTFLACHLFRSLITEKSTCASKCFFQWSALTRMKRVAQQLVKQGFALWSVPSAHGNVTARFASWRQRRRFIQATGLCFIFAKRMLHFFDSEVFRNFVDAFPRGDLLAHLFGSVDRFEPAKDLKYL